ncbi:hypothetical protein Tco_1033875 [Tanacetum coccineum]
MKMNLKHHDNTIRTLDDKIGMLTQSYVLDEETQEVEEVEETKEVTTSYDLPIITHYVAPYEPLIPFLGCLTHHVDEALVRKTMESIGLVPSCRMILDLEPLSLSFDFYKKGETLREFYLRFSLLLNDMNIYNMKLKQFQVNINFLNTLPLEWSKFVTDVKQLGSGFCTPTKQDQLHFLLGKHEFHANEVRLNARRNFRSHASVHPIDDPAPLSNTSKLIPKHSKFQSQVPPFIFLSISFSRMESPITHQNYSTSSIITPLFNHYPSKWIINAYNSPNVLISPSSISSMKVLPTVNQQSEFSQPDSDDLLEYSNHDNMKNRNKYAKQVVAMAITSSKQSNVAAVSNSNSFAQQDALILSVIEQQKLN